MTISEDPPSPSAPPLSSDKEISEKDPIWMVDDGEVSALPTQTPRQAFFRKAMIYSSLCLVVLVLLVVTIYFLFPREPSVQFVNVFPILDSLEIQRDPPVFDLDLNVTVNVRNKNYFSLRSSSMEAKVYYPEIPGFTDGKTLLGSAQPFKLDIPTRDSEEISVIVTCHYEVMNSEVVFAAILFECQSTGKVELIVEVKLKGLFGFGFFNIKTTQLLKVECDRAPIT